MSIRKIISSGRTLRDIKFFLGNAQDLIQILLSQKDKSVHFASAHTNTSCLNDDLLVSDLSRNTVVADSSYLARFISFFEPGIQNIRGIDFFREFLESPTGRIRNYFVVADQVSASRLQSYLSTHHREIVSAGIFVPSINSDWRVLYSEIAFDIVNREVDLIWVGVGSPKQDSICAKLSSELHINSVAIGAAVKFLTGEVKEAPGLLRKYRLEWLHRILQDPRRLAPRYLNDFIPFLFCLMGYAALKFRSRFLRT